MKNSIFALLFLMGVNGLQAMDADQYNSDIDDDTRIKEVTALLNLGWSERQTILKEKASSSAKADFILSAVEGAGRQDNAQAQRDFERHTKDKAYKSLMPLIVGKRLSPLVGVLENIRHRLYSAQDYEQAAHANILLRQQYKHHLKHAIDRKDVDDQSFCRYFLGQLYLSTAKRDNNGYLRVDVHYLNKARVCFDAIMQVDPHSSPVSASFREIAHNGLQKIDALSCNPPDFERAAQLCEHEE